MTAAPHDPTEPKIGDLERAVFDLDQEQTQQFLQDLANPPAPNEALRRLMSKATPWDAEVSTDHD